MLPFTIESLASQMRTGNLRATELLNQCLEQIDWHNQHLCAWVLVDREQARDQAQRLDNELEAGRYRGPLHGMPIGIKDIIDVRGWPTLAGSPLRAGHVARADAPLVSALRDRGAVIIGKTVTTEFAGFDPAATRNPWNPECTPGGSSSGSAAAVAMRMCVAAIGSQTGGSITRPASFCGVCGLKPTLGFVSTQGIVPISHRLDHPGLIARSARDLALVLEAIAEPEQPGHEKLAALFDRGEFARPPRLALLEAFFMTEADADVQAATRAAVKMLERAGAMIESVPLPPEFDDAIRRHRAIMAADMAQMHRDEFQRQPESFGRNMAAMIEEGLQVDPSVYDEAAKQQVLLAEEIGRICRSFDALITPATTTAAPPMATTGDPRFNSPWSYAGVPTVSLPCSLSPAGLPCAIQLIAEKGADAPLLQVADWCERRLGFDCEPPLLASRA